MARAHLASCSDLDAELRVERLEYVRLGQRLVVVRLLAGLGSELTPPAGAILVVERGDETTTYEARGCKIQRARRPRILGGELLWRAFFAVPLDVVEYPHALFELAAPGRGALTLPVPALHVLAAQGVAEARSSPLGGRPVRRQLVVAVTTLAIAGWAPGIALAAAGADHGGAGAPRGSAAPRGAHAALSLHGLDSFSTHRATPPALRRSGGATEGLVSGKRPGPGKTGPGKTGPGKTGPSKSPGPRRRPARTVHARHPAAGRLDGLAPPATPAGRLPGKPPGVAPSAPRTAHHHASHHHHAADTPSGGASTGSPRSRRHVHAVDPRPPHGHEISTPPQTPTASAVPTSGAAVAGLGPGPGNAAATAWSRLSKLLANGDRPPAFLIPIYRAAGHRYHLPWPVLAAINSIESDYGRDVSTSSAGAIGWMQFMPATWAEYGVSAGRHTRPDPYDPRDAIFSAARYLAANGAAHNLRKAIFAYNHATWYVDEVLWTAASIANHTPVPGSRVRVKLDAMQAMARALDGEPYIWGGGHSGWAIAPGYDCSGFVSTVLHAAGYLEAPASTQTLPSEPHILPGPGRYVTLFDRTDGGAADDDHVIIDINGRWWESGGSSAAGGAPGVHRIASISATYLLTFNEILHPRGL